MAVRCGSDDGIKLKKLIIKYINILLVLALVIGAGGETLCDEATG